MRVLLDYRPALRHRTGVGEYVHGLAHAVAATRPPDESLALFSASWRDRLRPDPQLDAGWIDRRIPVRALNFAWHRWEWPTIERVTGRRFDVVHAAHPLMIPSRHGARVITVHDLDFLDHPERTRAEIRRDYPALAGSHARRADAVIAVSHATAEAVEARLGVPRSRITVCSPGAPDWPRRPEEPALGCILFLGTLEPRKNLGLLLDAYVRLLTRLPSAPPLIFAGGKGPGAEQLVSRAEQPDLRGRVQFLGYVDPAARMAAYDLALVLVMPSFLEGFGLPALEAMTRGIPVVAANRGALPEVVGDAGWLFDPRDADALAHALEAIVTDPNRRAAMRERGWQQAARFQWTETANRVREAWKQAVLRRAERE